VGSSAREDSSDGAGSIVGRAEEDDTALGGGWNADDGLVPSLNLSLKDPSKDEAIVLTIGSAVTLSLARGFSAAALFLKPLARRPRA